MNISSVGPFWDSQRRGRVAVLLLRRPPGNALSSVFCGDLHAEIDRMLGDDAVDAIVLGTALDHFSAGIDSAEMVQPMRGSKAALGALCQLLERTQKPVVAAIHGACLGSGLELAIAAHARIASQDAKFAFPETNLGLMPAAGSSRRLPALIGPQPAVDFLLGAKSIDPPQALDIGLIDAIATADVVQMACGFAEKMVAGGVPPRRDASKDGIALQHAVLAHRQTIKGAQLAVFDKILDCCHASLVFPPEQALKFEQTVYDDLLFSPQVQGLSYAVLAQQSLQSAPHPRPVPRGAAPKTIEQINLLGSGDLIQILALKAMAAGLGVHLVDAPENRLMNAVLYLSQVLELQVAAGQLTEAERDKVWARMRSSTQVADFDGSAIFSQNGEGGHWDIELSVSIKPVKTGKGLLVLPNQGPWQYAIDPAAPDHVFTGLDSLFGILGVQARDLNHVSNLVTSTRQRMSQILRFLDSRGQDRNMVLDALSVAGLGSQRRLAPAKTTEILDAIIFGLANLGASYLRQGVVSRAKDFDAIAAQSGLFPRPLGGPLFQTDLRGPLVVRSKLRQLAQDAPDLFTPDTAFDDVIAKGRLFGETYAAPPKSMGGSSTPNRV